MNPWTNRRRSEASRGRRRPASFPVGPERLERKTLLSNFVVTSAANAGAGSLRSALTASNSATGQTNTITFNIPGSGVQRIALTSALPAVTNPVVIDATTVTGYATSPLIELDGTNAPAGTTGLVIAGSATGTVVKGLDLHSFGGDGIEVLANNVVLSANFIGTGPAGDSAAGNHGSGVVVWGSNDTVGGVNVFNPDGTFQVMGGNLISGNAGNGVVLAGAGNLVEGNWIGVDSTGKSALGNAHDGVVIDGVSSNTVGGTTAGTRNVISGNLGQGVSVANVAAPPPGSYSTSAGPLKLTPAGISAGFSLSNFATNFPASGSPLAFGPFGITFPVTGGVLVSDFHTSVYKFLTDTDGQVATTVPKLSNGYNLGGMAQLNGHIYAPGANSVLEVDSSGRVLQTIASVSTAIAIAADTVPGPMYGHLLVSTNGSSAPSIYDVDPVAKTAKFVASLPGRGDGVALDPVENILYVAGGGEVTGYDLSTKKRVWNSGLFTRAEGGPDGIALGSGDLRNELLVNTNGGTNGGTIVEVPLGSPSTHIIIASGGTRGDLAAVDPNNGTFLLTQSDRVVRLFPPLGGGFKGGPTTTTAANVVEGNLIGLGADGTTPVGNGSDGVVIASGAAGNTIGGTLAGQGNTIAANKGHGVALFDPGTLTNAVLGNSIGTDVSGSVVAGNLGDGVWLGSSVAGNRVAGNTIANNAMDGVGLDSTTSGTAIQANRIYGNKGLGINRGTGSNNGPGIPVLSAAFGTANASYVAGTAAGPAGSVLTIDFYANTDRDPSGYGQGQFYLGSTTVTAGSSFQALLPVGANPGEWISATATSASGDTSGFSADIAVARVTTSASLSSSAGTSTYGQGVDFVATVAGAPAPTGTVQFLVDGGALGGAVPVDPATGIATSPSVASLQAGTHTVTAIYSGDSLHDGLTTTMTQSVNKAPLTVTADDKVKAVGAPLPAFTFTATGFVNGDTPAVLTGSPSYSTTGNASSKPGTYEIDVAVGTLAATNYDLNGFTPGKLIVTSGSATDFDATGRAELAVFRPSSSQWFAYGPTGGQLVTTYGAPNLGDIPVSGDFDGVGHAEPAYFRPSTSQWFVMGPGGSHLFGTFGAPNLFDIPVPGDYDGVGHAEMAVFRPSTSEWFVFGPTGGHLLTQFGAPNLADIPIAGDFDGVGHAEPAVFRPATSEWFVFGPGGGHRLGTFGAPNLFDIPVPDDYDGVGHAEMAVFRPSTSQWFVMGPTGGHLATDSGGTFGAPKLFDIPLGGQAASLKRLGKLGGIRGKSVPSGPAAHAVAASPTPAPPATLRRNAVSAPMTAWAAVAANDPGVLDALIPVAPSPDAPGSAPRGPGGKHRKTGSAWLVALEQLVDE